MTIHVEAHPRSPVLAANLARVLLQVPVGDSNDNPAELFWQVSRTIERALHGLAQFLERRLVNVAPESQIVRHTELLDGGFSGGSEHPVDGDRVPVQA